MRTLLVAAALLLALPAGAQGADTPTDVARLQAELQALHAELNRARRARDRAALERIYAPEFRWVHGVGYADDRTRQIANIIEADSDRDLPPLDFSPPTELILAGDMVVMRRPERTISAMRLYSVEIFVRRAGRWQILHLQGTPLRAAPAALALPAAALDAYPGRYRSERGTETVITRAGDLLQARIPEVPIRELRAVAPDRFVDRIGTEYMFERGADGRVTGFSFRMVTGREGRAARVE